MSIQKRMAPADREAAREMIRQREHHREQAAQLTNEKLAERFNVNTKTIARLSVKVTGGQGRR